MIEYPTPRTPQLETRTPNLEMTSFQDLTQLFYWACHYIFTCISLQFQHTNPVGMESL